GLIENHLFIRTLSDLGVSFLLFLVGLKIDIKEFRGLGYTAMTVTFLQTLVTAVVVFSLANVLQLGLMQSIYIGIAAMFSSTVVVIKILDEKEELDRLYGRIDLGVL
ncbi:MAG: cation:proton antiporter, partial [Candidatus Nanohaloarchaea archaeon]|nr:cation:proton antiporter [Candidatus Nanohaloarchaea archaeon]